MYVCLKIFKKPKLKFPGTTHYNFSQLFVSRIWHHCLHAKMNTYNLFQCIKEICKSPDRWFCIDRKMHHKPQTDVIKLTNCNERLNISNEFDINF